MRLFVLCSTMSRAIELYMDKNFVLQDLMKSDQYVENTSRILVVKAKWLCKFYTHPTLSTLGCRKFSRVRKSQ